MNETRGYETRGGWNEEEYSKLNESAFNFFISYESDQTKDLILHSLHFQACCVANTVKSSNMSEKSQERNRKDKKLSEV